MNYRNYLDRRARTRSHPGRVRAFAINGGKMSNLQIGRTTDGALSLTITDLTETELSELIRVATNDRRAKSPAKARLMRNPTRK